MNLKKIIAVTLSFIFIFSLFVNGISASSIPSVGDMDQNGAFNSVDLLMMRKTIISDSSVDSLEYGDMNEDDIINAKDILIARRILVHLLSVSEFEKTYRTTVDVVTKPTCTEKGYTTHTYPSGKSYTDTYVDALGHSWGDWVRTVSPTLTSTGKEVRTCSVCGETETRTVEKLASAYSLGADMSKYQGDVNWDALASYVDYVVLRLSYDANGVTLNGVSHVDSKLVSYYDEASSRGLEIGAYWFMYDASVAEAEEDARSCVKVLEGRKWNLPIALDVEGASISYISRMGVTPTKALVSEMVSAWCKIVSDAGYNVMIYTNPSTAYTMNGTGYLTDACMSPYSTWIADWYTSESLSVSEIQDIISGNETFPSGTGALYTNAIMWQFGKGAGGDWAVGSSQLDLDLMDQKRHGALNFRVQSADGNLEGVEFKITGYSSYGTNVSNQNLRTPSNELMEGTTVTTNSDGWACIKHLEIGTYTITEINTNEKYSQPKSQTVEITWGGNSAVWFTNTVKPESERSHGTVNITLDADDDAVEGVRFEISGTSIYGTDVSDQSGKLDQDRNTMNGNNIVITNVDGWSCIRHLEIGTYTITELDQDGSYETTDPVVFSVASGQNAVASFDNVRHTGALDILLTSDDGIKEGVELTISGTSKYGTDVNDQVIKNISHDQILGTSQLTNADGWMCWTELEVGTYTITETDPDNKYEKTEYTIEIVKNQNNVLNIANITK